MNESQTTPDWQRVYHKLRKLVFNRICITNILLSETGRSQGCPLAKFHSKFRFFAIFSIFFPLKKKETYPYL